jgi:PAS domain S-box-containing protein
MNIREKLKSKLAKIDLSSLSDEQVDAMNKLLEKPTSKNKTDISLSESEKKYRNIFENIQTVYYEAAIDGTILEISPSVEYYTKYKREDLLGMDVFDAYFKREDRAKLLQQISKDGKLRDYSIEVKDKDGSKLHGSLNAQLIRNKAGVPEKIVGAIIDITQLHKTINALKISEERYREIYENAQDIIWTSDLEGNFISMNPVSEKIMGYRFEDEVNPSIKKYLTPESYKIAFENIRRKLMGEKTGTTYEVEAVGKGGRRFLEISSFLKYKDNKPIEIFGIARDITERKKAEEELGKTRAKYIELFESTNDIIYTMDFNGNFTSVNPMAEKILGYKFEEITEMNMASYISPETAVMAFDNIAKKLRGEEASTLYEVDFINKDGSYTTLEINSMISYKNGKPVEIFGIARNITERRKTEEELNKTREKYKELSESTNDLIYTVNLEQKFSSMHPKCEKMIGYKVEEILGKKVTDFITPESLKASDENLRKKLKGEAANTIYEVDFKKKNGSVISLEVNSMFRYKDGKPYEILGVARDITERRRVNEALKKSEEKYKTIFENAPLGIMTANNNGDILEINSTLLQLLGSESLEETKKINMLNYQPLIDAGFVDAFNRCISTGNSTVTETVYNSKWGKSFDARTYTKPIKDSTGSVMGFQVIVEDITEEKLAEKHLKTAITEKEALLRELHHRVKNNMQIIISLINMQMHESNDDEMIGKLRDIQQRVWSMAIIHEDLYMAKNLSKINFGNYLKKLANNVANAYSENSSINLKFNVSDVFLDLDNAIPCGLIVNELLSNSFKHAFPENLKGKDNEVFIELKAVGNKFLLTLGDNGIGMKEHDKNTERNTLGLVLVEILVNQLKGSIKLYNKKGTRYEIELDNK